MSGHFDDGAPDGERLPRRFTVTLVDEPCPEGGLVRTAVDGVHIGIPLVDGGWSPVIGDEPPEPDTTDDGADRLQDATGARWHDALHVAHAVCLGWSPVLRELLDLRRVSDPRVAEAEDGPAAARAEEQVAWAVFRFAREHVAEPAVQADAGLLASARALTADLEVAVRSDAEWLHALDTGLSTLRLLWRHGCGELQGDLDTRSLVFRPLPTVDGRRDRVGTEAHRRVPAGV